MATYSVTVFLPVEVTWILTRKRFYIPIWTGEEERGGGGWKPAHLVQLLLINFCPKGTGLLKICFAPIHLVGLEMVRDAFLASRLGKNVLPKTKFWCKIIKGPQPPPGGVPTPTKRDATPHQQAGVSLGEGWRPLRWGVEPSWSSNSTVLHLDIYLLSWWWGALWACGIGCS